MTSSCPQPPDMGDCKSKKRRCLSGPCVGFTYTQGEECSEGAKFNPATCTCEPNCVRPGDATVEISWPTQAFQSCGTGGVCGSTRTIQGDTQVHEYTNVGLPLSLVRDDRDPVALGGGCWQPGRHEFSVQDGNGDEIDRIYPTLLSSPVCSSSELVTTATASITDQEVYPCPDYEIFNEETCECEPEHPPGVYEIAITLVEGSPRSTGSTVKYNYFVIQEPEFGPQGQLIQWAPGLESYKEGEVCMKEDGCIPGNSQFATWSTFCANDTGNPLPPEGVGPDPVNALYFSPWYTPGNYGRGICPHVCDLNPNYHALGDGRPRMRVRKYSDSEYYGAVLPIIYPLAQDASCSTGQLNVMYSASSPAYIGPGVLCDYFSDISDCTQFNTSSDTPLVPDLPGPT